MRASNVAFAAAVEVFMIFCLIDLPLMTGSVPLVPELIVAAMAIAGFLKVNQLRRHLVQHGKGGSDE